MIKIFATGNLINDAKVFFYGEGKSGVSFCIASNDRGSETADFLNCTMFNRDERFAELLKKGNQVIVHGRYKKNDEGYVSCIVDELEFGISRNSRNNNDSQINNYY